MKKYITLKELSDCDHRTQNALGYGNIPKGAEVEFIKYFQNFYGFYARVKYEGTYYDVNP